MTDDIENTDGLRRVREAFENAEDVLPYPGNEPPPATVHNLPPRRNELRQHAQALLAKTEPAGDMKAVLDRPYLVKGWLDRGSVSMLYGPSNTGKSFLAVNIAHHVSKGREWGARRVNGGRVMYVAAEGGANFRNRVAALDEPKFWTLCDGIALAGVRSAERPFTEVLKYIAETGGAPFDLIIIDTLSRVMGGADENNAPDISDLLEKLDFIQMETNAHIMLIHHIGKDAARGARGHSSLRAAVDTEIELTRDETGLITAEVTKQRDGPTGYKFRFSLKQVELGMDNDGDPVTTCLVEPAETAGAVRAAVSGSAHRAFEILGKIIESDGAIARDPSYPGTPCIAVEKWRDACSEDAAVSGASDKEGRRRAFYRARKALEEARWVLTRDDLVWRVET